MVVRYNRLPIRGTQYLTRGLGIEKVNDPTMSGVMLVLRLVRSLSAWSRLWSKHEMRAAELSDEVQSEVQASTVSVREFRCESNRQIYIGTCLFAFTSWLLRATLKLVTSIFSPQQLMLN